jgi:hypothetical protein
MTQQTAVKSFWNKIALKLSVEQINEFLPEFQEANEMFQEQIMKAYDDGAIDTMQEQEGLDISMDQNGEESGKYYNKTYNK